jgi:hypothetical protein
VTPELWVLSTELASCHVSGTWNLEVALKFWKICAPLFICAYIYGVIKEAVSSLDHIASLISRFI